jgi:hypothetical protein
MRSAVAQAKNAYNQANASANQYGEQANQERSSLVPGLEREANNPEGFTPEELNNQLVASEQGAGGSTAGIVGQANLNAARSRNSAGYTSALDEAAREKNKTLSENALNIRTKSDELGQEKQMAAQKELGGIMGGDVSANLEAQGLETKDIEAEAEANQTGWVQSMNTIMDSIKKGSEAFKNVMGGMAGGGG